jgi:D-alanyl-D-alanine dipeptidase
MTYLYDNLAGSYDRMISWKRRLKRERPFFARIFKEYRVKRILDTACGTGMHAAAFHDWGYYVVGTDISAPMIEKSRENAGHREIEFIQASFTELGKTEGLFDAVTCLGNSLPHVLSDEELDASLSNMFDALIPGGVAVIHQNNYDRILASQERFMPLAHMPKAGDGSEYLFLRFFDFRDDLLGFNVITLTKTKGEWTMSSEASTHRALTREMLCGRLEKTGFEVCGVYGGYPAEPFDKLASDNLIVVARKPFTNASQPYPEPVSAIDRMPVHDNGEPLVEAASAIPGVLKEDKPVYARKSVVEMLRKAQSSLPDGYRLKLRVLFRTMAFQEAAYKRLYERLTEEHPDWPASQLRREINKYLAPPDAKHPPGHTTGGAVDVYIAGPDGEELDTNSSIVSDANLRKLFPTYSKIITPRAAKNRQILFDAMLAAGFSNYPGEWWHYSYGDSAWAVRVGAPCAFYGAASPDLPPDILEELSRLREWK